jgi:DNA-binding CsgD family transcriptional regulator
VLTRGVGFRGRTSEFDQLRTTLARAAAGTTFLATIEGEAGIGKSRLVEEATQAVGGLRVLRGKASELERERPFGPVLDALDLRTHELAAMPSSAAAEHVPSVDAARQFAIADLLLDVFERASADGPVVLVLEDVHWADAATLALAARLARQRGPLNTSLLCTRRPSPRSADLEALLRSLAEEGGVEVRLGPLADAAVDEIVAELAGAPPGPALSARVRGASGNPLYVIEFVEGLAGELTEGSGLADVADPTAPSSLPLTILHRLGLLPAETIDLLRSAAVLGASFPLRELAAVTRRPALELAPLLQPAIDGGVLVATTDGFRFRHDLIHEAAYADIPAPVRRALHADAAATLAAEPEADVAHVARHFELGTEGPDAIASDWLWKAATATFGLDRHTSLELMSRAIARTPVGHPSLLDRRVAEATRTANLPGRDRLDRVRAMLREPLPDRYRWAIEAALVSGLALVGAFDEAEQLAYATPRPRAAQLQMAVSLVGARCLLGDPDGADRVIDNLLSSVAGDEADDARLLHHYLGDDGDSLGFADIWLAFCRAFVAWTRGENEAGPAIARRAEELGRRMGMPPQALDGATLMLAGDSIDAGWRDSLRWIGSVASHAFPEIDAGAGVAHWFAGEWDEALAQFETARRRAEDSGPRVTSALYALAALIEAERGHSTVARTWLAESRMLPSSTGLGSWVEAVIAEVEGDLEGSGHLLIEAWLRDNQAGVGVWRKQYAPDLVRRALASGDEGFAQDVVSVVESLVPRGGDVAQAVAAHCRALLGGRSTDLVEAAGALRRVGRPLDAARAEEDTAAALAMSDAPQARQLFDRASAVYEGLDARRDLQRLARRLRAAGLSPKTPPAPRPLTGWRSLTASELRVAELVSQGLTYRAIGERLYVSRRTVETHVAHVFVKLGVRSKAELASSYVLRFGG